MLSLVAAILVLSISQAIVNAGNLFNGLASVFAGIPPHSSNPQTVLQLINEYERLDNDFLGISSAARSVNETSCCDEIQLRNNISKLTDILSEIIQRENYEVYEVLYVLSCI